MEQIKQLFKSHDVVVLIGKCGSGKTYQSCQFIQANQDNRYIVITNDSTNYANHLIGYLSQSKVYQRLTIIESFRYPETGISNLISHLSKLSKTEPNYLILDDCPVSLQQQVLNFTRNNQVENLKILLTCFSSKELVGLETCAQLMLDK